MNVWTILATLLWPEPARPEPVERFERLERMTAEQEHEAEQMERQLTRLAALSANARAQSRQWRGYERRTRHAPWYGPERRHPL